MVSINAVKFDFDVIDKVDEVLQKHGIKFSYHEFMEKLLKRYGDDMKTFCDDYSTDFYIEWNDCSAWKKKYKKLNIDLDTTIIEIERGFINNVYFPDKIEETSTYDLCFNNSEYIGTLEELDKWLTEIETRLDSYLYLVTSENTKNLYNEFISCKTEKEKFNKQLEDKKKKIIKSINLVLSAKKDFT